MYVCLLSLCGYLYVDVACVVGALLLLYVLYLMVFAVCVVIGFVFSNVWIVSVCCYVRAVLCYRCLVVSQCVYALYCHRCVCGYRCVVFSCICILASVYAVLMRVVM